MTKAKLVSALAWREKVHEYELPDEDKEATLLMQIASKCLDEGIPMAHAQGLTMLHPVLNHDKLLAQKYASFDPETSFRKIGNALNDIQFNFESKRTKKHMEYWLIGK